MNNPRRSQLNDIRVLRFNKKPNFLVARIRRATKNRFFIFLYIPYINIDIKGEYDIKRGAIINWLFLQFELKDLFQFLCFAHHNNANWTTKKYA